MALLLKQTARPQGSQSQPAIVDQWIKVSQPAVALPASTTGQIFRVQGGRVLVKALVGEVTTLIQTQACNMKVSSKKLTDAAAAVGTAVDVAANVDVTAREVGGLYFVEGDGTAGVLSNAGAAFVGTNSGNWVAPQGEIYVTTSATNTGAMKWDIWYQPLDPGARVVPATLTNSVLTAAI
jgi:hypothetical protein